MVTFNQMQNNFILAFPLFYIVKICNIELALFVPIRELAACGTLENNYS